ncbi:uncharacterized protein LOC122860078 isoform X1 [Aphidius gifuensis]|uniref:uncharacterized protein LOC122860078 isoform X1 n=1 Tax=Aphidius gifuensis TaxID=684658 RepID=UPI001CDBE642|nr:uncharacterized protein LOC122860078 isoform X1 [Aphidius gifuensis]
MAVINEEEWQARFIAIVEDVISNPVRGNAAAKKALILERLEPILINQPQLNRICQNTNNSFVKSGFLEYVFSTECYNESINEETNDLEYLINLCGSKLLQLHAPGYTNSKIMQSIKNTCTRLQAITLCFREMNSNDFINVFDNIQNLRILRINWGCVNSTLPMTLVRSLESLVGSLKHLQLNRTHADDIFLPDSLASVFHQLTVIDKLYVAYFGLSQIIIQSISGMINLTDINIFFFKLNNHPLFDENIDMYPIGNLKNLKSLHLYCDYGITDRFLINLCNNAKELTDLNIIGTNISDNGMMAINNLKHLKIMNLNLEKFRFESINKLITDQSI